MPSAVTVTLRNVVHATEEIAEASGVGHKTRTTEQDFKHVTDTTNYGTALTSISSEIYSYIAGLTGTVTFIQGVVRIPHTDAVATPFGYSSKVGSYSTTDANEAEAGEANYFTRSYSIAPGQYSSAATLKTALQTEIAACIAQTSYT